IQRSAISARGKMNPDNKCRDDTRKQTLASCGQGLDTLRSQPSQPGICAFLAEGGLAAGGGDGGVLDAGVAGAPSEPPQQTSALAWQVCSSKTMKLRNSSHFTSFLPTVYLAMPFSFVQVTMYLSSRSLASLVGPSLP